MMRLLSTLATIGGVVTFGAFLIDKYVQLGLTQYIAPVYLLLFGSLCLAVILTHAALRLSQRIRWFMKIPVFLNGVSMCTSSLAIQLLDAAEQGRSPHLNTALKELCGSVATFFERLTRAPCAVCIKLLINKDISEPHVRTLVRDLDSDVKRRAIDDKLQSYPYTHNTAFNQIITRGDSYSFFLSNNLPKMHKKKTYRNENHNWREYYNATLVVPIAATDNPTLKDATGFLCVDTQVGRFSGFPRFIAPHVLSTIAKQLYFLLTLNDRVLSQPASSVLSQPATRTANRAAKGG